MKAIICLFIQQSTAIVYAYGEFQWSKKHQCHIWQGRELEMDEFNRVVDGVLEETDYFKPGGRTVRLFEDVAPAPAPVPALIPPRTVPVVKHTRKPAAKKPTAKVAFIAVPALT